MSFLRRNPLVTLFGRDTPALPLDLLRILIGVLALFYFTNIWRETAEISAPDGLVDHVLVQDIFWFTRISLFQPGVSSAVLEAAYLIAIMASVAVIVGWWTKFFAATLFAIAVSVFRWNFLVAYVEDAIMDLMLFWLLLLPVGRTLTLGDAGRDPRAAWIRWQQVRVPGSVVGWFLCNLALIYVVAGLWKWTSPMWREGTALFAVLKLPVSRAPDFWGLQHLPLLRAFDWGALVLEPIFPLTILLRRGHPLKWLLLVGIVAFHLGIVATMRIPVANLACLGGGVVIFREEIMAWITGTAPSMRATTKPMAAGWGGRIAATFVAILTLAMLRYVPVATEVRRTQYAAAELSIDPRGAGGLATIHKPLYCALWFAGLAQEYQLFNWIDTRNHRLRYDITFHDGRVTQRIDPAELFPDSNRSALLQGYLHDLCWFAIPTARNAELKHSLALRFAERYAKTHPLRGIVVVASTVERITATYPWTIERGPAVLFSFTTDDGKAVLLQVPPEAQASPSTEITSGRDRL